MYLLTCLNEVDPRRFEKPEVKPEFAKAEILAPDSLKELSVTGYIRHVNFAQGLSILSCADAEF